MMGVSRILTAACLFLFCVPSFCGDVTCFYTNWAQYRTGAARFTVSNINAALCTKINYAFAKLVGNNIEGYEWNDEDMWQQLNNLKPTNPQLKTFLSVGGATLGHAPFSTMVSSSDNRKAFISSAISILRTWNFDGLDIDWEFPVATDKQNLKLLTQEIFSAFETEGKNTNRPRLLLSFCVPAGINTINNGYDISGMISYLDFLNVMAYDYHGSWEYTTNLNSPLNDPGDRLCVSTTVDYYLSLGAPASKLVLGLAFYARTWAVTGSPTNIGAPANGPGPKGEFTKTPGFLAYYEVCAYVRTSGLVPQYESTYGYVNYGAKDGVWITYENVTSLEEKVKYIQRKSLGGAMIWTIDFDDFSGQFCGQDTYPLTRVVSNLLMSMPATVATTPASSPSTTPANTTTTSQTATTTTTTSQTATTTTATSTSKSTVATPATSTVCSSKFGFFPESSDCSYYFVCENGNATRHIKCNPGAIFNPNNKTCENLATTTYTCPNQTSTTASTTASTMVSTTATTTASTRVSTTASTTTPTTRVSTTTPKTTVPTTTPTTTVSTTTPPTTASTTTPTTTVSTTTPTTTVSTTTPTTTVSTTIPTTTVSTTTPTTTVSTTTRTTTVSTTTPATTVSTTTPTTTVSTTTPTTTVSTTTPISTSNLTSTAVVTPKAPTNAPNASNFICSSKFGFFPDSSDCSYYFVCENGNATRHIKCNPGAIFNPNNKTCENLATTTYTCPNQTSTTASTMVSTTATTTASTRVSTTASTTTPKTRVSTTTPTTASTTIPTTTVSTTTSPTTASTTTPKTTVSTTTPTTTVSTTTPTTTVSTTTPTTTVTTTTPTSTFSLTSTAAVTPKSPPNVPNACNFTCPRRIGIFPSSNCSYYNVCYYWRVVCIRCPGEQIYNPKNTKCEPTSASTYTCPN